VDRLREYFAPEDRLAQPPTDDVTQPTADTASTTDTTQRQSDTATNTQPPNTLSSQASDNLNASQGNSSTTSLNTKAHTDITQTVGPAQTTTQTNNSAPIAQSQTGSPQWYEVERLLGTRMQNKKRFFKVKWLDPLSKPSWEPEQNISENLKREYYAFYTKTGTRRKRN